MTATHRVATACLVILLGSAGFAQQPAATVNGVTPGDLVVDPPTLINLGFEWLIDGDANRNAKVDVSYRKVGESAWKTGMPLLRLQGERVTQPNVFALVSPNMFAGSILDLEPDAAYEARFALSDPDGVSGAAANATRTVTVRTRPEPKPAEGGKVYHVYPVGYTGPKPSRRSPASCAPTTITVARAIRRRADGRASSRVTRSSFMPAHTHIDTSSTQTRRRSTRRRRSRGPITSPPTAHLRSQL